MCFVKDAASNLDDIRVIDTSVLSILKAPTANLELLNW